MADFYIEKLVVKGAEKRMLLRNLTKNAIISGPSNTGKTTIIRCIDYIFGSDNLPFSSTTGLRYNYALCHNRGWRNSIYTQTRIEQNDVVSSDDRIESGTYKTKRNEIYGTYQQDLACADWYRR